MEQSKKNRVMVIVDLYQEIHLIGLGKFPILRWRDSSFGHLVTHENVDHGVDKYSVYFDTMEDNKKLIHTVNYTPAKEFLTISSIGHKQVAHVFKAGGWGISQFSSYQFCDSDRIRCKNFTKSIDVQLNGAGGFIEATYELWAGDAHLGFYNYDLFMK